MIGIGVDRRDPVVGPCIARLERKHFVEIGEGVVPVLQSFLDQRFVEIAIAVIRINRRGFVDQVQARSGRRVSICEIGRDALDVVCPKTIWICSQCLVADADCVVVPVGGIVPVCLDIKRVGFRSWKRGRGRRRGGG